jgi:tRNA(Arg) A34 adenosine deaminase TadA
MEDVINTLIQIAIKSQVEHKISAALLHHNKIISIPTCNTYYNSSVSKLYTTHAEINAIKQLYKSEIYLSPYMNKIIFNKKYNKLDLCVIRVNNKGKLMNSRPCMHCLKLMKTIGIRNVYYSSSDTTMVKESVKNMISTHITSGWRKCQMM